MNPANDSADKTPLSPSEKPSEGPRAAWELPTVEVLGKASEDTENEFNFLADANQLT